MEVRQLQYFLTVADELHFGKAAQRLHIVQSAVSQQIRRLEHELGVALFDRSTRTVRLTEAGHRLIPHAQRVLAEVAQARLSIDDLRTEHAATVRLGTSTGLGNHLDVVLDRFARLAPDANLELSTDTAEARIRQVRSGALDAALLRGEHSGTGLEMLRVWDDPLVVALPGRHHLSEKETVELSDLADLPLRLASRARNPVLYDLIVACCDQAGFAPAFGPEFTTDQDTLAAIGFGKPSWTVYYSSQATQIAAPGVAFRTLRNPEPIVQTYLALRPDRPRAELRALIEACQPVVLQ
jgi:DNA-binding transcriptional LysR family regulator